MQLTYHACFEDMGVRETQHKNRGKYANSMEHSQSRNPNSEPQNCETDMLTMTHIFIENGCVAELVLFSAVKLLIVFLHEVPL